MEIALKDLPAPGNRLGSGEFGRVFESKYNNQEVIYKIMKHAIHSSIFYNEIRIMNTLSHPNIPRLFGYCKDANFMCLVMEKVNCIDLFHYIQYYDISKKTKIQISKSIIETLRYIHSRCVIYRDLKPENIMIDLVSSDIKFVDFGLAKVLTKPIQGIAGTPGYIAPEILKNDSYGYPADVYSFGMTLFVLWSERAPTKKTLIPVYLKNTPETFRNLVMECVQHDPSKRPGIDEIIERLQKQRSHRLRKYPLTFFCF